MAIIRNECPLLEFSTDQRVYLEPETAEKTLPRLCLVTYFEEILDAFVEHYDAVQIEDYVTEMRSFPIWQASVEGYEVGVTLGVLGSCGAAKQLDYLYGHGAEIVISCDSCGVLDPNLDSGVAVIPVRALRAEGASYHYVGASRFIQLQDAIIETERNVLNLRATPYVKCTTWTTDAPYRESIEMVSYRREEGCRVVDTQVSAMAAVAQARKKGFGALLYAGDRLESFANHEDDIYEEHDEARKKIFLLALEILCRAQARKMHTMELDAKFFEMFRHGEKQVEIRLLDEKRRSVRVGDLITFQKPDGESMQVKVVELIATPSFGELYERATPDELGFPGANRRDFISAMHSIYPQTREKQLGVLGIRVERI